MRPNGVAIFGDYLFVTERDNHRVQVLALPGFQSLGTFGEAQLRSPYGLWLNENAPGELEVYVTDSFMEGARFDVVPALDQLDQRVRRYRVDIADDGTFEARYDGAFGDTSHEAALRIVESIAGDASHDRLLIADEYSLEGNRRHLSTLREYTFAGRYTGRSLPPGSFDAEAEGVALWSCSVDGGYWVAVDQLSPLSALPPVRPQDARAARQLHRPRHGADRRHRPAGERDRALSRPARCSPCTTTRPWPRSTCATSSHALSLDPACLP